MWGQWSVGALTLDSPVAPGWFRHSGVVLGAESNLFCQPLVGLKNHTNTHTHTHTHTHTNTHSYTHVQTHIHTYTKHTHTHTKHTLACTQHTHITTQTHAHVGSVPYTSRNKISTFVTLVKFEERLSLNHCHVICHVITLVRRTHCRVYLLVGAIRATGGGLQQSTGVGCPYQIHGEVRHQCTEDGGGGCSAAATGELEQIHRGKSRGQAP